MKREVIRGTNFNQNAGEQKLHYYESTTIDFHGPVCLGAGSGRRIAGADAGSHARADAGSHAGADASDRATADAADPVSSAPPGQPGLHEHSTRRFHRY